MISVKIVSCSRAHDFATFWRSHWCNSSVHQICQQALLEYWKSCEVCTCLCEVLLKLLFISLPFLFSSYSFKKWLVSIIYIRCRILQRKVRVKPYPELVDSGLTQLSSSEWAWVVQHVLSVCFRRIERLKIFPGTNVDLHMRRTKITN